jgi:putative PEP-CTERM system histidine kinase
LFISGVGYYVRFFGGEWGRALQLGLVFLALVALTLLAFSGSVRAKLRVFLGKHFFHYRYDYREEWLRFTQTLSVQSSPQHMGEQVIRGLADMLESPAGALWMKVPNDQAFRQTARWNMAQIEDLEDDSSALCQFMRRTGWVVNLEEYRSIPRRYAQLSLPTWLLGMVQAWLIVPLCVGDELIGFVVLASARTSLDVNWDVNDLLKTAGRQAASFLAQMQATEALLEVRKFDAFNRMSAFVVHDLKNIVTQLSLMMKNAKRLHANPEFQQDMLMTIENSLEKMRQLMLQLREGATPTGTAFGVDLCRVVQRIESAVAGRGRKVEIRLLDRVFARGHEERLERVIGHVIQNALDATDSEGSVWLKLDRQAGQARVEVGDTGHGMSQEFIRDRLFKPFQTTKNSGMGIGAYESFQYVRELGGSISVKSEPGHGTEVTLLLPLFEAQNDSDLQVIRSS